MRCIVWTSSDCLNADLFILIHLSYSLALKRLSLEVLWLMSWFWLWSHLNLLLAFNLLLVGWISWWLRWCVLVPSITTICNYLGTLLIHLLLLLDLRFFTLRRISRGKTLPWNMRSLTFNLRWRIIGNLWLLCLRLLCTKDWNTINTLVELKFSTVITFIRKTSPVNLLYILTIEIFITGLIQQLLNICVFNRGLPHRHAFALRVVFGFFNIQEVFLIRNRCTFLCISRDNLKLRVLKVLNFRLLNFLGLSSVNTSKAWLVVQCCLTCP